MKRLAEPRTLSPHSRSHVPPARPILFDQHGQNAAVAPKRPEKIKRVAVRLFRQGIRAGEASGMAAVLGYTYGRWGDADGKSMITRVPFDLLAGFGLEIAASLTENDSASEHLEALAIGALSLHAGAWGRARGHEDRAAAAAREAKAAEAKALPPVASAKGLLDELGARSPERGTASLSEEELARLVTRH